MARLRVKKPFVDKYDHKVAYKPGQVITIEDPEREKDLVERGLCTVVKGNTSGNKEDKLEDAQKASGEAEVNEDPEAEPQQSEE